MAGDEGGGVAVPVHGLRVRGLKACYAAVLALAILVAAFPAAADCTDPPIPGVDWQRCSFDGLDLSGVDLTGARLREGSFLRTDFSGAVLAKIEGHRAKLINADLQGADLSEAYLFLADLTKANLAGARLDGTDLRGAKLYRANLRGADLSRARLGDADLTQADLSGATWTNGSYVCREGSIGRCN